MTTEFAPALGLRIDPLDVLFFREGRPFDAATRVESKSPNPQTFAGAMRTSLLAQSNFRFQEFGKRRRSASPGLAQLRSDLEACGAPPWVLDAHFRGPWLALYSPDGKQVEPILPQPLSIAEGDQNNWVRATPRDTFPGWIDEKLKPILWSGERKAKQVARLITLSGMKAILQKTGMPDASEFFETKDLYGHDNRVGIAVDKDTFTSADGQIYGIRFLSLKDRVKRKAGEKYDGWRVGLYGEIRLPSGNTLAAEPLLVPFGGEGKYVHVERVSPCDWPKPTTKTNYWVLATPCFFPGSTSREHALPRVPGLCGALTGHPISLSGWDIARNGPHPIRFGVPAGSVYFFNQLIELDHQSFAVDAEDRQQGWGFALPGEHE